MTNPYTMCSAAGTSHFLPTWPAPRYAGCKRTLAVYDPAAAAEQRSDAGALVPSPVAGEPINAVPLAACAPNGKAMPLAATSALVALPVAGEPINAVPLAAAAAPQEDRAEPPWIRAPGGLLWSVGFRVDIPVYFVDEKMLTATDVDPHQNRFRLPSDAVMSNILPHLSHLERVASNLVHEGPPRPRLPRLPAVPGEKGARKKRRGKDHGGLPVLLTEYHAGVRELQLSRWDSSGVCIIKGEGYMDFINRCGFKVGDVVEIWAIKEKNFHFFGVNLCRVSPLCIFLTKKSEILPPPPRALPPPNALVPYGGEETAQDDAPKLVP